MSKECSDVVYAGNEKRHFRFRNEEFIINHNKSTFKEVVKTKPPILQNEYGVSM